MMMLRGMVSFCVPCYKLWDLYFLRGCPQNAEGKVTHWGPEGDPRVVRGGSSLVADTNISLP